ncbi:hypothetical protein JQF37_01950 [Pseudomonas sp. MIL9]|uniref:hypothetical protein n=1 Tax=Pseudomonas sp. MIL9 TaxID=2807620 RepID=UPI00194E8E76|nr:hypothetical protein [Pseudomonas sp. MIL9]MBM6442390.1 hypothetical protein [Pseudomonas sp. MIL9]
MTPEQFCYWLQGYFELKQTIDHRAGATPETMKVIEDHLKTVFVKVTPEVQMQPVKIEWPADTKPIDITEAIRKSFRDAQRSPYYGQPIQITC